MSALPRILMATSEMSPFAQTGGLGDVLDALPAALAQLGAEVHVVLPAYRSIPVHHADRSETLSVWTGATMRDVEFRSTSRGPVRVSFVVADEYFGRDELYGGPAGDYPDNADRFAFFSRAVLALAARLDPGPDILHCHDWQTALAPVFARVGGTPGQRSLRTLLTIHNLGYQGIFPAEVWSLLGLDWSYFTPRHLEFYGQVNLLKGGIVFADALTTVSRRYASEILEPEYGHGLDGVLRERRHQLHGILNGIDTDRWDPSRDPAIAAPYSAADLSGKARCKAALQAAFGLPAAPETPLFGVVSRLADQKGLDILLAAIPELLRLDLQLVILGRGDAGFESALTAQARRTPERVAVRIAFDDSVAHQIEAGADAFLMPSRYEPCGLNQMYSLRYGTVPVVRATGGLDDTVSDFDAAAGLGNGFTFTPYTAEALVAAVRRAVDVYRRPADWRRLIATGMAADFSWRVSARRYLELYAQMLATADRPQ